jgi:hypothetical protein
MEGGLSPYRETSELCPCRTFIFKRQQRAGMDRWGCRDDLDNCLGGTITIEDLLRALAHDDVRRALAAGKVLYGEDTRPVDGQVLKIEMNGAIIEVGQPCQSALCTPIPPGVDALGNILRSLTTQELARPSCRMALPSP